MKIRIVIPARLESIRFPNKLIKKINKKTIIEHIFDHAKKIPSDSLILATDSTKLKEIAIDNNISFWYSKKKYHCGTERIAAACKDLKFNKKDIVVNIQGDEFNFPINSIKKLINYLKHLRKNEVATIVAKNKSKNAFNNRDQVKVILNKNNYAKYFSREPIPHKINSIFYEHIGVYGYNVSTLERYSQLDKSPYEKVENLEQLRFIWNDVPIKCICENKNDSISINSPNDLKLAKRMFR